MKTQIMVLTAQHRIQQIKNAQTNFYLGLAAGELLQNREHYRVLTDVSAPPIGGKYGFNFSEVVKLLDHPEAGHYARQEFLAMLFRTMLKEPFEIVKAYANDHDASHDLKRQPWFHIARILRNSASHDFTFSFNNFDLRLLPLEWNGIRLERGMAGRHMEFDDVPAAAVKELVSELREFIKSHVGQGR